MVYTLPAKVYDLTAIDTVLAYCLSLLILLRERAEGPLQRRSTNSARILS